MQPRSDWPVLRSYSGEYLREIAMPLGGIGTGTVSLGGRGDLRDWEVMQRPAKGFTPDVAFFAIAATNRATGATLAKLLEGPLDMRLNSANGIRARWHGLPRFRAAEFHAAYPMAQVILSDETFPVSVRLEAFNPLTPTDADSSGLPLAVLRYTVENLTDDALSVSLCGSIANYIGHDGSEGQAKRNTIEIRSGDNIFGLFYGSDGVPADAPQCGTMALALLDAEDYEITHRTSWGETTHPFRRLTDFWRDFSCDGRLSSREAGGSDAPVGSLAAAAELPARASRSFTFVLTWRFPNRYTWTPQAAAADASDAADGCDCGESCDCRSNPDCIGNYYASLASDAWEFALLARDHLRELERRTAAFVSALVSSDLPEVVKEAALFNLPPMRSQTSFRTPDGRFYGWEGCNDSAGCCYGANPHVWNYEHATALLFGEISRTMRDVELAHATDEIGNMSFRVNLPIERGTEMGKNAADGQMGCIVKLYRDWKLSGDDAFLRRLWPKARLAMEFAWRPGSWDADGDGVMEGIQHNTTDLNFYGPNAMMAGWYHAALAAAAEMADALDDAAFAARCRDLAAAGRKWVCEHLFNGEYFEQEIRIPPPDAEPAPGIASNIFMTETDDDIPPEQPGTGCMTDQLIGQYMARMVGLPDVFDPDQIDRALAATYRYNFVGPLYDHANPIRAFAVNDESMVTVGSYPNGEPAVPCFRFYENWTGVEYAFAVNLLFAGRIDWGLEVIAAVRERFDGKKRNPFDEPECGRHYARAMASWSALVALTGFSYDGRRREIAFSVPDAPRTRWFFSTGSCWGVAAMSRNEHAVTVMITVGEGTLPLETIQLSGHGSAEVEPAGTLDSGDTRVVVVRDSR